MPITEELATKIKGYVDEGHTSEDIISGLQDSKNYPDVAAKVKQYKDEGHSADDILQGLQSAPRTTAAPKPIDLPALKDQGTLEKLTSFGKGVLTDLGSTALQVGKYASMLDPFSGEAKLKAIGDARSKLLTFEGERKPMTKLGEFAGGLIPALAMPEISLPGKLGKLATPVAQGGIIGATTYANKPKDIATNVLLGAGLGGAVGLGVATERGIRKGVGDAYKWNVENKAAVTEAQNLKTKLEALGPEGRSLMESFAPKGASIAEVQDKIVSNIRETYTKLKTTSNEMYDNVKSLVSGGPKIVELSNTQKAVEPLIKRQEGLPPSYLNSSFFKKLVDLKEYHAPNWDAANEMRQLIAKDVQIARDSGNKLATARYEKIQSAFMKDLQTYGNKISPEFKTELNKAIKFEENKVKPIEEHDILNQVVTNKKYDTDKLVDAFIKPDRPTKAEELHSVLDQAHRKLLKSYVMKDAFQLAEKDGEFNPAIFARVLREKGSTKGIIFTTKEQKTIDGYIDLVHTLNADKKVVNLKLANDQKLESNDLLNVLNPTKGVLHKVKDWGAKELRTLFMDDTGQELLRKVAYVDPRRQPEKVRKYIELAEKYMIQRGAIGAGQQANKSYKQVLQEKESE